MPRSGLSLIADGLLDGCFLTSICLPCISIDSVGTPGANNALIRFKTNFRSNRRADISLLPETEEYNGSSIDLTEQSFNFKLLG